MKHVPRIRHWLMLCNNPPPFYTAFPCFRFKHKVYNGSLYLYAAKFRRESKKDKTIKLSNFNTYTVTLNKFVNNSITNVAKIHSAVLTKTLSKVSWIKTTSRWNQRTEVLICRSLLGKKYRTGGFRSTV